MSTPVFETLKKLSNFCVVEREEYVGLKKTPKRVWRISREFMWDSYWPEWEYIKPSLKKSFPLGDVLYGDSDTLENNPENTTLLHNWVNNKCLKCDGFLYWFEGDKRVSYRCDKCADETPFVKGAWAF
jgi:hypothetical protein